MNIKTFEKIILKNGYKKTDINNILYNCGYFIEELKAYKNKIYKPAYYSIGKPVYKITVENEINIGDCI